MRLGSITKLSRDVEYTTDREAFEFRLKFQGVDIKYIPLLWKMYKLIHLTDYAPDRVREVFKKDVRYQDVAEKYDISLGTVKKQVHDFTTRLSELWGRDDIIDKIRTGEDIDENYLEQLERIIDDSLKKSHVIVENLEDKFSVNILEGADVNMDFSDIDRDDFVQLRNKLVSFSKPSQEFILKNTDKELLSYGVYLLTTPEENLTSSDRERRKELITFTKIQ